MITVSVMTPAPLVSKRRPRQGRSPEMSGRSVDLSEYLPIEEVERDYIPIHEVRAGYIRRHGLRAAPIRMIFNIKQGY